MERDINGVLLHWVEHGAGPPLVALHGAGVDHREIEAALEALPASAGRRRIYPDLPGMGRSTTGTLAGNNDVVALLLDFLEHLRAGPVVLAGHSYGAYLARGVAARRQELVAGLLLICPVSQEAHEVPAHGVVQQDPDAHDDLPAALRQGFDGYFVVRTRATARRYRGQVAPGMALADEAALARIFTHWTVDTGPGIFAGPVLIVAGRNDSVVGHVDAVELCSRYPRASLAVVDGAGHALMHERPGLLSGLLADWLEHLEQGTRSRLGENPL